MGKIGKAPYTSEKGSLSFISCCFTALKYATTMNNKKQASRWVQVANTYIPSEVGNPIVKGGRQGDREGPWTRCIFLKKAPSRHYLTQFNHIPVDYFKVKSINGFFPAQISPLLFFVFVCMVLEICPKH
jgi:hypothetical protein